MSAGFYLTLNILNVYYKYTNLCSQFTIALGKEGTKIKDFLLRDKVYKYLKNKISKHEYKPGSPIIEKEIENALSVSRTPIREAIRKLEQESLVEVFPRKGAFVSNISVKRIVEIYDIREIIEPNIIPIIINIFFIKSDNKSTVKVLSLSPSIICLIILGISN